MKLITIILLLLAPVTFWAQLAEDNKGPGGLFVLNEQLKDIFNTSTKTFNYNPLQVSLSITSEQRDHTLIIIGESFTPKEEELEILNKYIENGNHVLVLAERYSDAVYENFNIRKAVKRKPLNSIELTKGPKIKREYSSVYFYNETHYFSSYDVDAVTTLGKNDDGSYNFIKMNKGAGSIYFHTMPMILVNAFILEKGTSNFEYTAEVLSFLPKTTNSVTVNLSNPEMFFDRGLNPNNSSDKTDGNNNSNVSNSDNRSLSDYLKKHPDLKAAALVALLAFLLGVLFALKRVQRPINIIQPVTNHSLDFAKTMGDLYYKVGSNDDIAQKKILFWKEHIRNKYSIATNKLDESFWQQLRKKTEVEGNVLNSLQKSILQIKDSGKVSNIALVQLCNLIDKFYKK